jgi:Tfp pilus assembly protein PilF
MRRIIIATLAIAAFAAPAVANGPRAAVMNATGGGSDVPRATGYEQIAAGRMHDAETMLSKQMEMHPGAPELSLNLAAVYVRTGRAARAEPLYRDVLRRPVVLMDMPSGRIASSHDVANRGLSTAAIDLASR